MPSAEKDFMPCQETKSHSREAPCLGKRQYSHAVCLGIQKVA